MTSHVNEDRDRDAREPRPERQSSPSDAVKFHPIPTNSDTHSNPIRTVRGAPQRSSRIRAQVFERRLRRNPGLTRSTREFAIAEISHFRDGGFPEMGRDGQSPERTHCSVDLNSNELDKA